MPPSIFFLRLSEVFLDAGFQSFFNGRWIRWIRRICLTVAHIRRIRVLKIAVLYCICLLRGHSHIESSHSLRQIDANGWVGLALWRYDLTHKISIIVKILFNFKKKTLVWIKANLLKTLYFNISKNQEFELITSCHFKNLISPKPAWNSQWSLIPSTNLKR